jgi:hypothetical protein
VADLQRQSARLQLQLLDRVTAYELARARSAQINARAEQLERQAEPAPDEASTLRYELGRFAAGLYRGGGVSEVRRSWVSSGRATRGPAMHTLSSLQRVGEAQSRRVTQAITAQNRAQQLAETTARAASIRQAAAATAAEAYKAIEAKTATVQAELASRLATLDASYRAREIEQDARNRAAWAL